MNGNYDMVHASHGDVVKRLRRAEGHLRRVTSMIEEQRSCVDVAQQLHAVERAIKRAKEAFVRDHIDHCLEAAAGESVESSDVLAEFKEISKYL